MARMSGMVARMARVVAGMTGVVVRSVLVTVTVRERSGREGEDEREERQHAEPGSTAARHSPGDS
jgi:hypothetical protein